MGISSPKSTTSLLMPPSGKSLVSAIQSLDALNDQLITFVFSPQALHLSTSERRNGEADESVQTAIHLMRTLLLDAQSKFRRMVEENRALGGRLDEDLTSANHQMALLREELTNTRRKVEMTSPPSSPSTSHQNPPNGHSFNGILSTNGFPEEDTRDWEKMDPEELRIQYQKALVENRRLRRDSSELRHAKEALCALKGDRKRLKAEKFELLNQMKELYVTLEEKEKELRDFIRNYEQRMRESETTQVRLMTERDEAERERWTILRHAREETERGIAFATQLNLRETQVQQLQEDLHQAKRQLSEYGIYAEPDRPPSIGKAQSHSLTPTYASLGDSRASGDSGLRLSSDRDSTNHGPTGPSPGGNFSDSPNGGGSLDLCGEVSGGEDSLSVISTATLPHLFPRPRESPGPMTLRSLDARGLSKSAEELLKAEAAEARRKSGRRSGGEALSRGGPKGAWGSISRVFARNKQRRALDPSLYHSVDGGDRTSWSAQSPVGEQESYGDKLRALEEAATLPMELWRAGMVQAWVEVSLGMAQYGTRCADNVKSGKVLLELSDSELESDLGIAHPLHRKKLRLAIEEHRNPALVRFPPIAELSHVWVSSEWLPDIGLPQYGESFAGGLVDGRLLDHLSKKDLEKYLGVTRKFHQGAIAHGVHLLRIVAYDRQHLAQRRRHCEGDPLVWTNEHFLQWARSIDLHEYAENLKGSGVHGAFAVLEPSFNGDTLASAMGIPPSKQIIRRHLAAELDALLLPARAKITQQYRVSKWRYSEAEKERGDSLGRSALPPNGLANENFRRKADESRRRTSLRGSLSRAFGLKIKEDRGKDGRKGCEESDSPVHLPPSNLPLGACRPPPMDKSPTSSGETRSRDTDSFASEDETHRRKRPSPEPIIIPQGAIQTPV